MSKSRAPVFFAIVFWLPARVQGKDLAVPTGVIQSLSKALKGVRALEQCTDLPDMSQRATRAPVDGVRLLPLAKGKFVIQVRCAQGAYNEFSLLFAWDEHSHSTPKLIQFPRPHGYEYLLPLVKLGSLGMREFEAKRAIVYVLEKIIGDGSGGFYAEYRMDRTTFVPELIIAITKPDADYANGYNFEHGRRPAGNGWKVTFGGPKYRGCLIDVRSIDRRYAGGRAGCP